MYKTNKIWAVLLACIMMFLPVVTTGCDKISNSPKLSNCGIIHETEFGGVYIKNTIDEFNALGFEYGDSVDVKFSNGYELLDIPYYNGYYTQTGEPLLIAYPGYDYIKAAINNGDDLWEVADLDLAPLLSSSLAQNRELLWNDANLDGNMTATITLAERGKYLDIQQARDIHYLDDRTKYPSDEVFANFRALKGGNLKEDLFYRSASPCDNQHNRASYVDKLIKKAGVQFIINLADSDAKIQGYMAKDDFASDYFATLYNKDDTDNDKVSALALNMNFGSQYFKEQTIKALMAISQNEGPFLIHCTEGKDRTGFLCMLLEAFAGATYNEIVEDYMITYFNYYAITKAFDQKRYTTIVENVLDPMIKTLSTDPNVNVKTANLAELARQYLLANGMTQTQIQALRTAICKA